MASAEGLGRARAALERAIDGLINKTLPPSLAPFAPSSSASVSREAVEDVVGFWVLWHLYGGFEGLERFGMHPSTIWRKVAKFRKVTGEHPDQFVMPGIRIDPKAYWASGVRKVGKHPRRT